MNDSNVQLLLEALIAAGIGLMVGLEREHRDLQQHEGEPQDPRHPIEILLGVRTFALLSLFGWTTAALVTQVPWLPAAGLLAVAVLVATAYYQSADTSRGLTTEAAALLTAVTGMLVHYQRLVAIALGLATTLLLIAKPFFRRLVPRLSRVDLTATLQLLIVLAIVLPLLPTEARDPWGVLSPRRIGLFITLIAGVNYVGYVLHRTLGVRRSYGILGLVGGVASSTALTVAMAQQARREPSTCAGGQAAVLIAGAVMYVRVIALAAVASRELAIAVAPSLGAMSFLSVAGAAWKWRAVRAFGGEAESGQLELQNPFSLVPAVKWGLFFVVILVASAVSRQLLGDLGLLFAAGASGLADVDAITLAVSRQVVRHSLEIGTGAWAVTIAVVANTLVKALIAWSGGGRAFGVDILRVSLLALAGGLLNALLFS